MSLSLRQRLLQADEAFLVALDTLELHDFQVVWNELAGDIVEAANAGRMSEEDLSLARLVSSRVTVLSESFFEFMQECDSISLFFEQDLESIVERHRSDRQRSLSHTSDNTPEASSTPYLKQAYGWLMNNIFNPYPSKQTRESIAQDACCDPRHVENWFADVRKRIGWNTIRNRHFSKKRSLTVAAATAFFQEKESNLLTDTIRLDFAIMLQQASALYEGRFVASELAQSIANNTCRKKNGRGSTPSDSDIPAFSISSSSSPSPQVDRTEEAQSAGSSNNSESSSIARKRKRSRSPDCGSPSSTQDTRKRIRLDDAREPSDTEVPETSIPPKRGRCLSESRNQFLPKHPSASLQLARHHTVSDLLPSRVLRTPPDPIAPDPAEIRCAPSSITDSSDNAFNHKSSPAVVDVVQQPHDPHSSASINAFSDEGSYLTRSLQEDIPHFSFELPGPVTCDQPTGTQPLDLTLYSPTVPQDPLTPIGGNLVTYPDPIPHVTPSLDIDITPWASLLNESSTNDHLLGLFSSLPSDPISIPPAETNLLPPLGGVDLSYSQFFSFDCAAPYPTSEPHIDNLFPTDSIEGINMNDLLSFAPPLMDTRAKVVQLEQLKKHRNRIEEYIALFETQLATTLSA